MDGRKSLRLPQLVDLSDAAQAILAAIRSDGGQPLIVGGLVRDELLKYLRGYSPHHPAAKDVDIEVHGDIDFLRLGRVLKDESKRLGAGWHIGYAGVSYYVLKVRTPAGEEFDISVPRRDVKTGEGHRGFTVETGETLSIKEASGRRDYTINAIAWDPETGDIHDPWGGLEDLTAGILRHTTAAFAEDELRVLRGIGFAARFGFTFAPETALLCKALLGSYSALAKERVWGEWEKIATRGTHISKAMQALEDTGWAILYPELSALRGVAQDPAWHPEGDVWVHTAMAADEAAKIADERGLTGVDRAVVVFGALCHDLGKPSTTCVEGWRITSKGHADAGVPLARCFLTSIGAPHGVIARVLPLIREHMAAYGTKDQAPTKPAVRRLARRLAPATMMEWAMVVHADRMGRTSAGRNGDVAWLWFGTWLSVAQEPARPDKGLLTGDDLITAGLTPGPGFKLILSAALEAQDNGDFTDHEGALAWLSEELSASQQEPKEDVS